MTDPFLKVKNVVLTEEEWKLAVAEMFGYCIECGAERECCEPDAREYECEECGSRSVYGAEELLLMN